jgi:hypothetical protein
MLVVCGLVLFFRNIKLAQQPLNRQGRKRRTSSVSWQIERQFVSFEPHQMRPFFNAITSY